LFIKNKKIDLVILAGGIGSRIKKHLDGKPKPMLKFNNKYFLSYIINNLSKYNFNKIIILTRYKSNIIHKKFHKKNFNFINVECINEKKKMGTGGALHLIKKKVNDFVLVNGDSIFDINIVNFTKKIKKNCLGVLALKKNLDQKSSKLNKLNLKNNYIYQSKKGKYMNGGVYFFKKKFLDYIPNKECSLESDILPELISKKKINGAIFNDFFIDIGSKTFLKKAPKLLLEKFSKKAVFLDRDGVINHDYKYVHSIKKFKFRKGVIKGLSLLSKKNYFIFIVTNQAGIGKKIFSLDSFKKLHIELKKIFSKKNVFINEVEYSPFHKDAKILKYKKISNFRKPGNLMIKSLFKNWDIQKKKSFMIGDKKSDFLAAKKSNLKFYYAENDFYKQIKSII
jgi:D,D-heptose 1,7-bisphosphate phosphatase